MRFAGLVCVGWLGLLVAQPGFARHHSFDPGPVPAPAPAPAAATDSPDCPAYFLKADNGGNPGNLAVNNEQVLGWEQSTRNQYTARGHVSGTIRDVYPDRNGHSHFSLQIGPNGTDTIEVVYNQDFGHAPDPRVGMQVEACGDYITSTAQSPGPNGQVYPASPDGAIIHWIHASPNSSRHSSGFLVMDGQLVGQDYYHAGPRPGYHTHEYAPGTDLNSR